MSKINADDFINELRFDIEEKDTIKAQLVLGHIHEVDANTQKLALFELSRADDEFVIPLIIDLIVKNPALDESYPMLRESLFSKALDHPAVFTDLLMREMRLEHRCILVEIVGEIRLEGATSVLLGVLNEEQDEKILRSTILALAAIGDAGITTSISEYLYSNSVELVIAAIHALGQLASPTAIQRLSEKLGDDHDLDLMIIDVFARAQTSEALEKLNLSLSSHHAYIRNAGKLQLVKMGSKVVPTLMNNLLHDDSDLLIHTLNVLGEIGDESAISAIRKLMFNEPRDANVRFAAYEALGMLPVAKGAVTLAAGLEDPVGNVRMAAASAIDHNYNTVLAAGIKNMVREDTPESRRIIRTLIVARCDKIFSGLIEEEYFKKSAVAYLADKAHPDTRSHFVKLLENCGMAALATEIQGDVKETLASATKVFAVDDSKMILNIYRSILHKLGYESVLFEFPQEAADCIDKEKPDLVLTDLNMPVMNGIELAANIRKSFDSKKMPIIMVTTQNETQDNEAAYAAGINLILHKPFTEETIRDAIAQVR
jgi:CheY-like chemotaxis protein